MHHIAINACDGTPHDVYVYHYSLNRSCLVDVVRVLFTTQQRLHTSYQNPCLDETFPALVVT